MWSSRFRKSELTLLACSALLIGTQSAGAETGKRDPEFSNLPFERWVSEGESAGIVGWSAEILPAELSTHQRLMLRVVIRVNGSALEKRRGAGEFVTLVQYRDRKDGVWQHHTSLDLTKFKPVAGTRQIAIAQYAFVLPGDYSLAIAICDTATLEHSLVFREVHAEPLNNDPLPEAWTGLPAIEFLPPITELPDVWYLPGIEHPLKLSLSTRLRVHVQLLVNTTPSAAGSIAALRANMSAAIPAMKVLSQIEVRNGSIDIALLDLSRRRVLFEQRDVRMLDWDGMRKVFLEAEPSKIDIRDLEAESKMGLFFRDEVSRRLAGPPGERQIVIVLSGPAYLQQQEKPNPIQSSVDGENLLFYIRFVNSAVAIPRSRMPLDDLQHAVEPLNAHLYEATSVEEFRRILASLLEQELLY